MVSIKARVGPKGQIVIPKVLRDEYNISPGDDVIMREDHQAIMIEKPQDPVEALRELAQRLKIRKRVDVHAIEEEYEERWGKKKLTT